MPHSARIARDPCSSDVEALHSIRRRNGGLGLDRGTEPGAGSLQEVYPRRSAPAREPLLALLLVRRALAPLAVVVPHGGGVYEHAEEQQHARRRQRGEPAVRREADALRRSRVSIRVGRWATSAAQGFGRSGS